MIDPRVIARCAARYDSFYLYDERAIQARLDRLKACFPQADFLYSIKCNPHPRILGSVFARGFGADAASAGEVRLARQAGLPAKRVYYSAPGKSDRDLEETLNACVLVADSLEEARRIGDLAARQGVAVRIGLRINPDFAFDGGEGLPSKFGVDEGPALEFARTFRHPNVRIAGIHVHLKSQELRPQALAGYYRRTLALAERFQAACGGLDFVNLGAGMGVPYGPADAPLDLTALSAAAGEALDAFRAAYPGARPLIETGRYAVCESGLYVTRVMERKVSRGKTYLILHNALGGFARPSLARLVMKYAAASPAASEPLFTAPDAFRIRTLKEGAPWETVTLAGRLCTAADVVAEDVRLPRLERGDLVILTHAGSYAAALSPMQFSGLEKAAELFYTAQGDLL